MNKSELEKYLGRKLTKKEYDIELKKFYKNFCRPETEEEKKEERKRLRKKYISKYEIHEYMLDWEKIYMFETYEDAKKKFTEIIINCPRKIAIFEKGKKIVEYEPIK